MRKRDGGGGGSPQWERLDVVVSSLSRWLRRTHRGLTARRTLAPVVVGLFTVTYFAATGSLAAMKPFSFEELTTYNIARVPTTGGVWTAWLEADDGMPPVVHFATHLTGYVLGFSHLTARLPAMVGFWVMCLCIFIFLGRRVDPLLALVGMLLPVTVPPAYSYAYYARGYGLVLGLCGAAVVCWDLARDTRWRRLALIGLPLFLAGAVATHAYAILVVVPLALAELTRTLARRRADWWVWAGLMAGALVILPVNPVIPQIRRTPELARYSGGPRVSVFALLQLWGEFLSISATYLGLLVLVCLWRVRSSPADRPTSAPIREALRPADWVLVIGLMALPAIGWVFANLVTRLLAFRYVIAAVIGFSLGVPLLCRAAVRRRPELALLLAAWVAVAAAASTVGARHALRATAFTLTDISAGQGCYRLLRVWEKLPADGLPIVVSDFFVFNQLHHYAPEPLKQRLLFVVDRQFGELIEPYVPFYARVFGQRMEGLEAFLRSQLSFYLYDCGEPSRTPLVARLLGAGVAVRDSGLLETNDILLRRDLYRVSGTSNGSGRPTP